MLDTFTQLHAELHAELHARRRQYTYYRDALLTFGERTDVDASIRWMTLGEICKSVSSGGTPLSTRTDYYGGDIPWLRTQEVRYTDILDTEIKITEKGLKESAQNGFRPIASLSLYQVQQQPGLQSIRFR